MVNIAPIGRNSSEKPITNIYRKLSKRDQLLSSVWRKIGKIGFMKGIENPIDDFFREYYYHLLGECPKEWTQPENSEGTEIKKYSKESFEKFSDVELEGLNNRLTDYIQELCNQIKQASENVLNPPKQ